MGNAFASTAQKGILNFYDRGARGKPAPSIGTANFLDKTEHVFYHNFHNRRNAIEPRQASDDSRRVLQSCADSAIC